MICPNCGGFLHWNDDNQCYECSCGYMEVPGED